MPSPTSSTRPISLASSLERYWLISVCRTETISSALNLMTASRNDLVSDLVQSGTQRAIENPIADPQLNAAEQLRINLHFQHRLDAQLVAHALADALELILGKRNGA